MSFFDKKYDNASPENVEQYYQEWTEIYQEDLGSFFQAMQADNMDDLVEYYIDTMNIQDGMSILDAGFGVLHGINISQKQVDIANQNMTQGEYKGNTDFKKGDFHLLDQYYESETFDGIYFMEALVHSDNPRKAIKACRKILKPNGFIYIKDLFKGPNHPEQPEIMEYPVNAVNQQFCLKVRDMGEIINILVENGFEIEFCRKPLFNSSFDRGNLFTAKHLFKLLDKQDGPWMDKGLIFLHWMEIKASRIY